MNYTEPKTEFPLDDIQNHQISTKVVLVDGHEPEVSLYFLKEAKKHGIPTLLDAGSVHRRTQLLLPEVNHLICSEKFAQDFTGESNAQLALDKLYHHNRSVIITCGEDGLIWKNELGNGELPAFSINAVDTTGAGDAFHGAFAACLVRQKTWEYSLKFSRAAAALCCTHLGGRSGLPTQEQVLAFLQNFPQNAEFD